MMIPYTLSPVAEAKTAFVEQYSSFLDLPLVLLARSLPSRLRDGKSLLTQFAREYHPGIRWAERASLKSEVGLLADTGLEPWVDTRVLTAAEAMGLPSAFGEDRVRQTAASRGSMQFITRLGTARFLRRVVPRNVVRRTRSIAGPLNAPQRRTALRLVIAQRAMEMLTDDARYGIAPCDREHLVGKGPV